MQNEEARRFLELLDPTASAFTFHVVSKGEPTPFLLCSTMHAPLSDLHPQLLELNQEGFGIFVTANPMDGKGSRAENVIGVRAISQNDTHGFEGDYPLPPSIVVANELGECQRVWLTSEPLGRRDFLTLQRALVTTYGSDKTAVDLAGLLQVPGFSTGHPLPFSTDLVEASGAMYSREALLKAFLPTDKLLPLLGSVATLPPTAGEILFIETTLKTLQPNKIWERVGMILHGIFDGQDDGFQLWVGWIGPREADVVEYRNFWKRLGEADLPRMGTRFLFRLVKGNRKISEEYFCSEVSVSPIEKRTLH